MPPPRGTLDNASVDRLKWEVEKLIAENAELSARLGAIERDLRARDEIERKRLMTGILMLGSVIMSLLGIIWAYRFVIFSRQG